MTKKIVKCAWMAIKGKGQELRKEIELGERPRGRKRTRGVFARYQEGTKKAG